MSIALVGKYVKLHDAYLSVAEALSHAGYENNARVKINWVDSEKLTEESCSRYLEGMDGVIVPGGFGGRGIQGMTHAAHYARVNRIPYFGICLGMQVAVIEYARTFSPGATSNSSEFDPECTHPVIDLMRTSRGTWPKGGTMPPGSLPL